MYCTYAFLCSMNLETCILSLMFFWYSYFIREKIPRGIDSKKIENLIRASKESIEVKEGCRMAEKELDYLLKRYKQLVADIEDMGHTIENLCKSCQRFIKSHK